MNFEILSSRRQTHRLWQQNSLRREQVERFDRAFVALRRKLREEVWQLLLPLMTTSPSSNEKDCQPIWAKRWMA